MLRVFAFLTCLLCAACATVAPQCVPAMPVVQPPSRPPLAGGEETLTGSANRDRIGRMVAPVMINGTGPYRFIVDTGANRSVVSRAVADALGLAAVGRGSVHTVQGVTEAPLVRADSLMFLNLSMPHGELPVLNDAMLAGEQGLLGADGMQGRRLILDFERMCIAIAPARTAAPLRGTWANVRGELLLGQILVVQGRIRNVSVNVLIDTGSNTSLANLALQEALRSTARPAQTPEQRARLITAGEPILLDRFILAPHLQLSTLTVENLLLYVGEFHVFSLLGLQDEPTVLIGMDVLRQAEAMQIDYARGVVQFQLRREPATGSRLPRSR